MYAFHRTFQRKKKLIPIYMHAETRLRNHGIRFVVARHFHCLHKFKIVPMRVASGMGHGAAQLPFSLRETVDSETRGILSSQCGYGQHAPEKVADRAAFRRACKVPASGNAFVEMVTDKCTRTTFLLAETRTWKAGLILSCRVPVTLLV